ncbi:MAG: ubiquinol-cytochrome c reductase iron-sulfur subunit [Longimicrobiales bacterium]
MSCDRRTFVRAAGLGVVAVALPGCASVAAVRVPRAGGAVRISLAEHPTLSRPDGMLKIVPEGFTTPVFIVAAAGGFVALSAVCQHLGCIVNARGDRFVCPCHGSTYGRDGRVLRGPTLRPLVRYPVERPGPDELVIRVGEAQ